MKEGEHHNCFRKDYYFFHVLFVAILAFVLGLIMVIISEQNDLIKDVLNISGSETEDSSYLKYYYKKVNQQDFCLDPLKNKTYTRVNSKKIVLVDECEINNLPRTIERINNCNPAVIAIDILMSGNYSDSLRSAIISACQVVGDKLVLVCYGHGTTTSSFVKDSLSSFNEGSAAIPADFWTYSYYDVMAKDDDDNCYPFFPWSILSAYSPTKNISEIVDKNFLVNYRNVCFYTVDAESILEEEWDRLKGELDGKIVIIGDKLRDTHQIPFIIEGENEVSGSLLHAYAVESVLTDTYYKKLDTIPNLLLSLIIILLYSALYIFYVEYIEGRLTPNQLKWLPVLFRPAILILFELLFFGLSVKMVEITGFVPHIAYVAVSIIFIDFMDRFYNSISARYE